MWKHMLLFKNSKFHVATLVTVVAIKESQDSSETEAIDKSNSTSFVQMCETTGYFTKHTNRKKALC